MKEETKELIDWIKKQINLTKRECIDSVWNGQHKWYNADYEKAMNFLDSLPQIESRLCKGGYIQDRNGMPCCDGDEVMFSYYVDAINVCKKKGVLKWSPTYGRFVIINDDKDEYKLINICEFEKVE